MLGFTSQHFLLITDWSVNTSCDVTVGKINSVGLPIWPYSSFDLLPSLDGCRSLTFHILILIILFLFLNDVWKVNYKITSFCSDCLYDKHGFHMQIVLFLISKLGCNYYVQTCLIFFPMSQVVMVTRGFAPGFWSVI